ncbi:unnamed protein product [Chrysoparadoxa australica]
MVRKSARQSDELGMETRSGRRMMSPEKKAPPRRSRSSSARKGKRPQSTSAASREVSAPFKYEFGGPVGAGCIMVGLPLLVLLLDTACTADACFSLGNVFSGEAWGELLEPFLHPTALWSWTAAMIVVLWLGFQVMLDRCLPGEMVEGAPLATGGRLSYCMNGHLAFWVSMLLVCHSKLLLAFDDDDTPRFTAASLFKLSLLYDYYPQLAVTAILISYVLSLALFAAAQRKGALPAAPGSSGNTIYDLFMGRELNPRIGGFDLKVFCELRPGLIGWAMLNLGMLSKQAELTGSVSLPMVMVNCFQGLYVWDSLHYERAILTTMDVTTDGFGFMLAFGDLAWLPFTYSLQAKYLVEHDPGLPVWAYAMICCLNLLGYAIFRGANSQKDAFRRDPTGPKVAHLEWMPTERGTKLLTSGWWGMARKINYTGDWLMALSWSLCCGFGSVWPYFYPIYFAVLLAHRAMRDDHACQHKYGRDWNRYKDLVPSIFIPGVI